MNSLDKACADIRELAARSNIEVPLITLTFKNREDQEKFRRAMKIDYYYQAFVSGYDFVANGVSVKLNNKESLKRTFIELFGS